MKEGGKNNVVGPQFAPASAPRHYLKIVLTQKNIIILAVLALLACIGAVVTYKTYFKPESTVVVNKHIIEQTTYTTYSSIRSTANQYQVGTDVWANTMGNAALYAAENNLCSEARQTLLEIEENAAKQIELINAYSTGVAKAC